MQTGMFRVKQWSACAWRGSSGGLDRSGRRRNTTAAWQAGALALAITIVLAGCSSPEEMAEGAGVVAKASATANTTTATASATGADGVAYEDNSEKGGGSREFAYKWPAQVSAVPALAERFSAERDTLLAEQKAEWEAAIAEFAGEDCVSCINRSFEKTWEVVADLPRFLSLSASFYEYSGGAHGNGAFDALVWDREAKAALDPQTMFRSPEALQKALGPAWCNALKQEKMTRLGADYYEDDFFPCPPIANLTLLPGSSNEQAFDRIGLLAAAYVAGPYVEGAYEATLPVTPTVLAAVKPEYKAAFALQK